VPMISPCETCEKRWKGKRKREGCQVFLVAPPGPGNCPAWTDDPAWERKINRLVEEYRTARGWS
jgi:hypothetical protein